MKSVSPATVLALPYHLVRVEWLSLPSRAHPTESSADRLPAGRSLSLLVFGHNFGSSLRNEVAQQ